MRRCGAAVAGSGGTPCGRGAGAGEQVGELGLQLVVRVGRDHRPDQVRGREGLGVDRAQQVGGDGRHALGRALDGLHQRMVAVEGFAQHAAGLGARAALAVGEDVELRAHLALDHRLGEGHAAGEVGEQREDVGAARGGALDAHEAETTAGVVVVHGEAGVVHQLHDGAHLAQPAGEAGLVAALHAGGEQAVDQVDRARGAVRAVDERAAAHGEVDGHEVAAGDGLAHQDGAARQHGALDGHGGRAAAGGVVDGVRGGGRGGGGRLLAHGLGHRGRHLHALGHLRHRVRGRRRRGLRELGLDQHREAGLADEGLLEHRGDVRRLHRAQARQAGDEEVDPAQPERLGDDDAGHAQLLAVLQHGGLAQVDDLGHVLVGDAVLERGGDGVLHQAVAVVGVEALGQGHLDHQAAEAGGRAPPGAHLGLGIEARDGAVQDAAALGLQQLGGDLEGEVVVAAVVGRVEGQGELALAAGAAHDGARLVDAARARAAPCRAAAAAPRRRSTSRSASARRRGRSCPASVRIMLLGTYQVL